MAIEKVPFTKAGFDRLKGELDKLIKVERPTIIEQIAAARELGDLKENAEYHAARERQGFIEARIKDLEDKLSRANIIDFAGQGVTQVRFGAKVTVEEDESGEEHQYQIVGDLEADITEKRISINSPIAKALMGKNVDDEVEVRVPKGEVVYTVISVEYD
jgi:transcription elongation factor GreA